MRTGLLADENTPPSFRRERVYLVLPQEARAWAARRGIEPPPVPLRKVSRQVSAVRLLTPDPHTIFQLTPLIPLEAQRVKLSAAVPSGTQEVSYWLRDSKGRETLIATATTEPYWAWWQLQVGEYAIIARARLIDGSQQESEAVPLRVIAYVPPERRPPSGDVE
jgi:hypothetical protein